jgi:hypothetical protein
MRWAGHVARSGEGRNVYRVLVGKPEGKDHLKDQGVDGRMGSKWTLGRLVEGCAVDSPGSGWGQLAGCCECGDEPSGPGSTEAVRWFYAVVYKFIKWKVASIFSHISSPEVCLLCCFMWNLVLVQGTKSFRTNSVLASHASLYPLLYM